MVLLGALFLLGRLVEVSRWIWVAGLAVAGVAIWFVYRQDGANKNALIPAYVLWAIAALIALTSFKFLIGPIIATFVLSAIALPFLLVYARDRKQWWALIPAYVLLAVALMVALIGFKLLRGAAIGTYILWAIAAPFLLVYLRNRKNWWALIPTYVLGSVGLMIGLIGVRLLTRFMIPAYIMYAIGLPFFVVYARNQKHWWALIPGGIMTALGTAFLLAAAATSKLVPVVLIAAGLWLVASQFLGRRNKSGSDEPEAVEPETIVAEQHEYKAP